MNKISDKIYYVGIADPKLKYFDIVMRTDFGTTYNSYIIKGEKVALVDAVHEKYKDEFLKNIEEVVPVTDINYIICNHTEPDHSGAISYILEKNPDITVVGTIAALKNLAKMLNKPFNQMLAKDGESLDLGGVEARFIITPNLHWPDTMMTYVESESSLLTCDFLGAHYAFDGIYDREIADVEGYKKSFKGYFDAIISPFKPFVTIAVNKLHGLKIDTVLPSHGPLLTDFVKDNIDTYIKWSVKVENMPKKISILYLSAYGYTEKLAIAAFSVLNAMGYDVKMYDVQKSTDSQVADAIENSDGIMLGTPTFNRNALKPIWDIVTSLDLIKAKNKSFAVFGSYGWSGEGTYLVNNLLKSMRLQTTDEPFRAIFNPDDESMQGMARFTKAFAENL